MQLIPIPPEKVDRVWPHVRELVKKTLVHSDLLEEQILELLIEGHLFLILGRQAKRCVGFMIFKPEGLNLHIVLMNSIVGADLSPYFDKFVKRQGVDSITFTSHRKGWERRAPQLGFESWATVYRKRL